MLVSENEVRNIVRQVMNPPPKIHGYGTEPFFNQRNAGMNGDFHSLQIVIRVNSGLVKDLNFFVKTPASSMLSFVDPRVSSEEFKFFKYVYPLLKYEYGETWSANCYLAKDDLLVFEDLRERGFAVRESSIYDAELLPALMALARFHAASILVEGKSATRRPLNRRFPDLFAEKSFTSSGINGRANMLGFETLAQIADDLGFNARFVPRIVEIAMNIVEPIEGACNVICHGDLWRTNIMFGNGPAGLECLLVDYQMLRYASPCTDVAMLIYVHTSREFRRNSELNLLDYYIDALRGILMKYGLQCKIPEREELRADYQRCKLLGMMCLATVWPRIVFTNVFADPVQLEKWYTESRIHVYRQCMDEDPAYREMMRANLEELFQEAYRFLPNPQ